MKKILGIAGLGGLLVLGSLNPLFAATFLGATPGNGGDSNPATFHFDYQNQDFQMTQPDGTPLADTDVQLTYGTALKIIYNNQDYVTSQGLSLQGTSLTNQDWTSLVYPPVGRVAVDPATGRFKFAQTWEGTTSPVAPDLGEPSRYPDIAINDSGYGFCAYNYPNTDKAYVQAHDPQMGWQNAVAAGSPTSVANYEIKIDMNSSGQAIYVLRESLGAHWRISANRYIPGLGWYGAVTIDADTGYGVHPPVIAMNDSGQAICSYINRGAGTWDQVWANEYNPATGWYQAVTIGAGDYRAFSSAVDMNNSGTAFCVFRQKDSGDVERIWGNQYIPGAGWQSAVILDHGPIVGVMSPDIAVSEDNYAICVFRNYDGIDARVSANVYVPGSGWQGAQRIDAGAGNDAREPKIAINQYGTGICVFRVLTGSDYRIYANHYIPGSGWQGAVAIDGGSSLYAASPEIDINDAGEAFCVFKKSNGSTNRVYANKYLPGSGWTGPVIIDANTGENTENPVVALNNRGLALAAFEQSFGSINRIYANKYISDVPPGPFQVNYSLVDPATTPDIPAQTRVQITNRKIEPIRGQQVIIQCALTDAGMVSIKIYDLQGKLIKVVKEGYHEQGTYSYAWNAINEQNSIVASGVYIVHIKLPGLTRTEKVVVIK